jgi:bifunctional non-homologous end joining protein LigD
MIAGFALDGSRSNGLYVGRRKGDDLVYAGKVDHGFDKISATDLRKRLEPLIRKTQAFAKRIAHKGHLGRAQPSGQDRVPRKVG